MNISIAQAELEIKKMFPVICSDIHHLMTNLSYK